MSDFVLSRLIFKKKSNCPKYKFLRQLLFVVSLLFCFWLELFDGDAVFNRSHDERKFIVSIRQHVFIQR